MKLESVGFANDGIQFFYRHDPGDGQLAHGQDELGAKQLHFTGEPVRTVTDFLLARYPIATSGILAGETTTHCGHIHLMPKALFFEANPFKPAEQGLARCPGEGPVHFDLPDTRGLADQ